MTNHEEKKPRVRLGVAGWVVLMFVLAVVGSIVGAGVYLLVSYANTIGG